MSSKKLVRRNVCKLIAKYPSLANDDRLLVVGYWRMIDGWDDDKELVYNIARATSWDTITRTRRLLHQQGIITYSDKVEEKRFNRFIEMRDEYSTKKSSFLTRLIGRK